MLTNKQKIAVATGLLLFAVIKIVMLVWWKNHHQIDDIKMLPESCDVLSGCVFSGNAKLRLDGVGDNRTPFRIIITGLPENTRMVWASFSMPNMDMGFNRFDLIRQNDGSWQANNVYLPLCSQSRYDWQIIWKINDTQQFQAAFRTKNSENS